MTVLSLLISGKSRDLLLIAAASSGSLHIYAQKFVKLNEQHKVWCFYYYYAFKYSIIRII